MDKPRDLVYISITSYIHHPLTNLLRNYIVLRDSSNEFVLLVYLLILVGSVLLLMYVVIKWDNYLRLQNAHYRLYKAASENDVITCISILERYPTLVNMALHPNGYTPFMTACMKGNTQTVKYMLNAGADIHKKSLRDETPFYLAAYHHVKNLELKDASCIHTLYYAGADINYANGKGYSPLQMAAVFGHCGLVRWLLSKGAKSNCLPDPYMLAVVQGHTKTAAILKNKYRHQS